VTAGTWATFSSADLGIVTLLIFSELLADIVYCMDMYNFIQDLFSQVNT